MNIEFLIVGTAKESEEDFHNLYHKMKVSVYTLCLSITKNKNMARDLAAETFRRVKRDAYKFDTELNGEYWILDIAYRLSQNALSDPAFRSQLSRQFLDNVSLLMGDLINNAKNERAAIVFLRLLSSMRKSDIAKLLNYYHASCNAEYTRAIKQLYANNKHYSKKEIIKTLKEDADAACPDYWIYINNPVNDKTSGLADELTEQPVIPQDTPSEEKPKNGRRIILITGILLFTVSLTCIVFYFFFKDREKEDTYDSTIIQYDNTTAMVELGGTLFYTSENAKDLCAFNVTTDKAGRVIIKDAHPKEIVTDGTYLYYRSQKNGFMYKTDATGSINTQISYLPGVSLTVQGNYLYFGSEDGIYRIALNSDVTTAEPELLLDTSYDSSLFCVDLDVAEDGTVFFCSGAGKGIHQIYDYNGTSLNKGLFSDEAYSIEYDNGYVYFDFAMSNSINLYKINLETLRIFTVGKTYSTYDTDDAPLGAEGTAAELSSGAFQIVDTVAYYAAKDGIYKVPFNGGESELVVKKTLDNTITDFYMSDEYIYCFYSDGKKDSDRQLVAYKLTNPDINVSIY